MAIVLHWTKVKLILNICLDLPEHQRIQKMDRLCGGDNRLREAVFVLLNVDEREFDFLEKPLLNRR